MLFESNVKWTFPTAETYPAGMFGAIRKHNIHTGIDLYVPFGTEVYPIEDGTVINIEWFTGPDSIPPSPWWNATEAVWVCSNNSDRVWVYGEVAANRAVINIGSKVTTKDVIGNVLQVLKKDKGVNPTTMLHLELYSNTPENTVVWELNEPKPDLLCDPMEYFTNVNTNQISK